jgi:hypothetical protein
MTVAALLVGREQTEGDHPIDCAGGGVVDLRQVRAIVTDSKVLSGLKLEAVTAYLRRAGWSAVHEHRTSFVWTLRTGDGVADVLVPKDEAYADYPIRMAELLSALAVVEGRSQLAVLADLLDGTEEAAG